MESPTFPEDLLDRPLDRHVFSFEPWEFAVTRYHILSSNCERENVDECPVNVVPCKYCEWKRELKLPHWPDMNFADNSLRVTHLPSNAFVDFNALDALRDVNYSEADEALKVAVSESWLEARKDSDIPGQSHTPYDWTFSTRYMGTYTGFEVSETEERIDLEALKEQEPILFYQEIPLFEDELADHGCSALLLKFRCMPSGFFALLRFYLRVDHVLVRIYDTRLHWKKGSDYLLREFVCREERVEDMNEEEEKNVTDPCALWSQLPIIFEKYHMLSLPSS